MQEPLTALVLGALLAASVVNQLPIRSWATLVARYDPWSVLPFWAFFAPNPGFAGTHVVFRDEDAAGWTGWVELAVPGTTGWRWVWNPGRFERKALQDLFNGLVRTHQVIKDPVALELTACYLALLAWVAAQPRLRVGSRRRQFAVLQAVGHGPTRTLEPVVVSRQYLVD